MSENHFHNISKRTFNPTPEPIFQPQTSTTTPPSPPNLRLPLPQPKITPHSPSLRFNTNLKNPIRIENIHPTRHESEIITPSRNSKLANQHAFRVPTVSERVSDLHFIKITSRYTQELTHRCHPHFRTMSTHCPQCPCGFHRGGLARRKRRAGGSAASCRRA